MAYFSRERNNDVSHHIQRDERPVAHVDGRSTELASLRERLVREREQSQSAQRKNEAKLEDERHHVQLLKREIIYLEKCMHDRQEALTRAHRMTDSVIEERDTAIEQKDTAIEEKKEAQRSQSTTWELVRNLRNEVESMHERLEFTWELVRNLRNKVQNKDERLIVLQQKYSHVDQEYRRLVFETGGTT